MNKRIVSFIFIGISIFLLPLRVNAVPGCCSWHGGEAGCSGGRTLCSDGTVSSCPCDGTSSNYGGSGYSSNGNYYQSNDIGDKIEMFFAIAIIGGFIALAIYGNVSDARDKKKHEEENEERKREARKRQIEFKKAEMKRIGTNYTSENHFINKLNNAMLDNSVNDELINDGYLYKIQSSELFKKINLNNSPETYLIYKKIVDRLVERGNSIEYYYELLFSILENQALNIKFFRYLLDKNIIDDSYTYSYNGMLVEKAIQINNKKAIELILEKDYLKGFNYTNLKVIYNTDIEVYNKILNDEKCRISQKSFEFEQIYKDNEKYMLAIYLKKGNINSNELNRVFKELININNVDLVEAFLDNCKTLYQLSQENLIFAYKNKNKAILTTLINRGFSKELFSSTTKQKKFEQYLYEDGEWFEVKKEPIKYDLDKQIAAYIRDNKYSEFVDAYQKLNFKEAQTKGETLLFLAIRYNRAEFVNYILKNGGSLDRLESYEETDGISPLEFAIYMNNYKIVEIIIKNDANVNYPDSEGYLPLDYACFMALNLKLCKFLIDNGAKASSEEIYNDIKEAIKYNEKYKLPYIYIHKISKLNEKYKKTRKR